ncbi:MAG: RDD family protein [Phycisphaeraceae bacterium]|nr:RDD family protein [Phycisphaeraceae bacterium]
MIATIGRWLSIACLFASAARGQLGAGTPPGEAPSHAWLVLLNDEGQSALTHLAPRWSLPGLRGAEPGSLRHVESLSTAPLAIAARGARVYLVFPRTGGPEAGYPVMSVGVTAQDGRWVDEPPLRLAAERAIPAGGDLVALAGTPDGVVALLRLPKDGFGLLVLDGSDWRPVSAPPELPTSGAGLSLVGLGSGVGIIAVEPSGRLDVWEGALSRVLPDPPRGDVPSNRTGRRADPSPVPATWDASWSRRTVAGGTAPQGSAPSFFWMAGRLMVIERAGEDRLRLRADIGGTLREIAKIDDVPGAWVAAWHEDVDRIIVAVAAEGSEPRVIEVSGASGRELATVQAQLGSRMLPGDVRLLVLALGGVLFVVLAFVLRSDRAATPLPAGFAVARDWRRVLAGGIDLLLCASAVSIVLGGSIADALTLAWVTGAPDAGFGLLWTLGVGFLSSSVLETVTGRTVGKALTGCVVARAAQTPRRIGLGSSLVRNAWRWLFPPGAWLAYLDADRRHRGDLLAGSVVVEPIRERDSGSEPPRS